MDRRKCLELLVLGTVAESIGSCVSAPVPASQIPSATNLISTATPTYFEQADHLFINTNSSVHYYVEGLSKREGVYQLRDLAKTSETEEGFVHVQAGSRSLWFEVGEQEEIIKNYGNEKLVLRQQINLGRVIIDILVPELQQMGFHAMEITANHLHPQKAIEDQIKHFDYNYGSSDSNGRLFKVRFSSEVLSLPSPADVLGYVMRNFLFREIELLGKVKKYEDYVVTPTGYFTLSVNERFSKKVQKAVEENGFVEFKEEFNRQINDILANASDNIGRASQTDTITLDLETALKALSEDKVYQDISINYHQL